MQTKSKTILVMTVAGVVYFLIIHFLTKQQTISRIFARNHAHIAVGMVTMHLASPNPILVYFFKRGAHTQVMFIAKG